MNKQIVSINEESFKAFKNEWRKNYGTYICHDLSDKQIKEWLCSQEYLINASTGMQVEYFSDYLLSQDLAQVTL